MLSNKPVVPTIPCSDLDACRDFYENKLGLKPSDITNPSDSILYDCGDGSHLLVYKTEAPRGGHTLCSFTCTDLESEMAELKDRGIEFEEIDLPGLKTEEGIFSDPSGTRSCWFKDPEGNILAVTEMKAMEQRMAA